MAAPCSQFRLGPPPQRNWQQAPLGLMQDLGCSGPVGPTAVRTEADELHLQIYSFERAYKCLQPLATTVKSAKRDI